MTLLAAQAYTVLGQIAAMRNEMAAAHADWTQARDTIAPATKAGDDPNFLAACASALLLLDEIDAARPVVARLAAMGYRASGFVALVAAKKLDYTVDANAIRRIAEAMRGSEKNPPD